MPSGSHPSLHWRWPKWVGCQPKVANGRPEGSSSFKAYPTKGSSCCQDCGSKSFWSKEIEIIFVEAFLRKLIMERRVTSSTTWDIGIASWCTLLDDRSCLFVLVKIGWSGDSYLNFGISSWIVQQIANIPNNFSILGCEISNHIDVLCLFADFQLYLWNIFWWLLQRTFDC